MSGQPKAVAKSEILAWFDVHRIDEEEREEFFTYILALDDVWMGFARDKLKEEQEKKK